MRVPNGAELWVKAVYTVAIDMRLEYDVQEAHFRSLRVSSTGDALLVENESGPRFAVDPDHGVATRLD